MAPNDVMKIAAVISVLLALAIGAVVAFGQESGGAGATGEVEVAYPDSANRAIHVTCASGCSSFGTAFPAVPR